jgi:hypothetical protein
MIRDEADLNPAWTAAVPEGVSGAKRLSTSQLAAPQKICRIWLDQGKFAAGSWMCRGK